MIPANDGEGLRLHKQEQLEAQFAALGCTVLPPDVRVDSPAFGAILAAVIMAPSALTQEQLRDIIDANE